MQAVINNTYQQVFAIGHIKIFSLKFPGYKVNYKTQNTNYNTKHQTIKWH
jgi:hypothetical protein